MTDLIFPTNGRDSRRAAATLRREKPLTWKAAARALSKSPQRWWFYRPPLYLRSQQ